MAKKYIWNPAMIGELEPLHDSMYDYERDGPVVFSEIDGVGKVVFHASILYRGVHSSIRVIVPGVAVSEPRLNDNRCWEVDVRVLTSDECKLVHPKLAELNGTDDIQYW